jgi:hypothetical protein
MDVALVGLVEAIIEWVDERFGRAAAWVVGVVGVAMVIAPPLGIALYLLR